MTGSSDSIDIRRQRYIAEHAPALLGQILNGRSATGVAPDPDACADLAIKAAEALYDKLTIHRPEF